MKTWWSFGAAAGALLFLVVLLAQQDQGEVLAFSAVPLHSLARRGRTTTVVRLANDTPSYAQLQQQIQSLQNELKKTKKMINDQRQAPRPQGPTGQEMIVNAIRESNKKLENAITGSNKKIEEKLSTIQRANRIEPALLRMEVMGHHPNIFRNEQRENAIQFLKRILVANLVDESSGRGYVLTDNERRYYDDNWIANTINTWTGIKPKFDVSGGKTVVHVLP
jgi:hypothetical protein